MASYRSQSSLLCLRETLYDPIRNIKELHMLVMIWEFFILCFIHASLQETLTFVSWFFHRVHSHQILIMTTVSTLWILDSVHRISFVTWDWQIDLRNIRSYESSLNLRWVLQMRLSFLIYFYFNILRQNEENTSVVILVRFAQLLSDCRVLADISYVHSTLAASSVSLMFVVVMILLYIWNI